MRSIDSTNHYRYGRSTLSLASAGVNKKWNMRRDHSSKINTADFHFATNNKGYLILFFFETYDLNKIRTTVPKSFFILKYY